MTNNAVGALILGFLALGAFVPVRQATGENPAPRPDAMQDSPAELSAWLDQNLPKMTAAMRTSKEVRAKIAGSLETKDARPFPLTPVATGLVQGDLERWSALANAAVAANPRYGHGERFRPRPTVTVMPHTRIVRVETTYPAPPASKDLEPGPLTINAWVCPDRQTALALFWLRSVALTIDTRSAETTRVSVLDTVSMAPLLEAKENPPGERAFWSYPRSIVSILLPKGHTPMPGDRLCFLRGNLVVEASTIEFAWSENQKKWLAWPLKRCAPDVTAVMRTIDAGLVRFEKSRDPRSS